MEACKTYIEQTKLLVTLASAFIVAPAALVPYFSATARVIGLQVEMAVRPILYAEYSFVGSVLAGYVVLATIAGSQYLGNFNVHRLATRLFSLLQIATYLFGLYRFVRFLSEVLQHTTG